MADDTEDNLKAKRAIIPLQQKIDLCIEAERLVKAEKKVSLKAFCRENNVQPSQIRRWWKKLVNMKKTLDNTTKKSMKLTCHIGKPSVLTEVEDKLLPWINAMRASGVVVTTRLAARTVHNQHGSDAV